MKKISINISRGNVELDPERILTNDIIFPGEFNPHNVRLWIVGNEFGALCAVWAASEQDALDEACDKGMLNSFLVSSEDEAKMSESEREELSHLGNAGESADLSYAWMEPVNLTKDQPINFMLALAEARGNGADSLDF